MKKFFLVLCLTSSAFGWDAVGHRVVAMIAQDNLNLKTRQKVDKLLDGQTLGDVANWADHVKSDPQWQHTYPWHYVSIADGQKYDVKKASKDGDIIQALGRMTAQLKDSKSTQEQKQQALKFIVHLIGDFHMPLHVGRMNDQGGNTVKVKWFGKTTNLHVIWDQNMIEMEKMSASEYAQFLKRKYTSVQSKHNSLDLESWVQEAMEIRPLVYQIPEKNAQKKGWEYQYRYRAMDALNLQLYRAGIRLAYWLNREIK